MAAAIGIDLGTTHCAMAAVRSGGRPEVLWNREGDLLTPSVVVFQGPGRVLVGKTAKHATKDLPGDCVESVKRHLDDPGWSFADSHGGTHSAVEITALILRRLTEDAAETLGHPVADAVIAVPAYFDDAGREATGRAAELAGLNVLRLVDEPTAAGIRSGTSESGSLLVYDLGGGTFDVTIMNLEGADPRVMATSGDRDLGGLDFDKRLMEHVAAEVKKQTGPDLLDGGRRQAELREKCEQARHALSRAFQTRVFLGGGDRSHTVEVSRERFERMTKDLLERTAVSTEEVLGEAGLDWAQIDRILLVGGSTRMPMVRRMIERRFGSVPDTSVNPDEAVALGAALLAAQGASRRRGPVVATPPSAVRSAGREKPRTGAEAHRRRPRAVRRRDGELH
jgi:molecular chaperone DnaK